MSRTLGTSSSGEFVNFNGLRVERSAIPSLVAFLVEADPMTPPRGEDLPDQKRETVSKLFLNRYREGNSEAMLIASLLRDQPALRYLAGLMASRL